MINVPLTNSSTLVAFIDDEDEDLICCKKWCATGPNWSPNGPNITKSNLIYALATDWSAFMHYLLLPDVPLGLTRDHKNRNGLDNRRNNLRICTRSQNQYNRAKQLNNTSGFKGVCWVPRRNKWRVDITVDKKRISLGYFSDVIEAALAYDRAALLYHGEFAQLNFPQE